MADSAVAPPGVGLLLNPALAGFIQTHTAHLDYLAVIPDRTWTDHGPGSDPRFEELVPLAESLEQAASTLPLVMHSIGLSICSAGVFDEGYIQHLAGWRKRFDCAWASDHLSFTRFGGGHEANAAVALPVPYDHELLELVVPRARQMAKDLGCPFLLENNVAYIQFPEEEMTEAAFLNTLAAESGCGILLDLHNVYANVCNHGTSARDILVSIDPEKVIEIHVAGGDEMMGFHTDSHAGPVREEVWEFLDEVAPRLPRLRGVTFEFHESSWPLLHDEGVLAQIERAREILRRAWRG